MNDYNLEETFGWLIDGVVEVLDRETLTHHDVLGMKWGVRKSKNQSSKIVGIGPESITRATKNGETITLTKDKPTAIASGIAKVSKKAAAYYNRGASFTIKNAQGKKVGTASVELRGRELYLNWINVKATSQGKGYATAILIAAQEFGAEMGINKLTLEVPGVSPDARHIYEKLGFIVTKESDTDGTWGGLTEMEYRMPDIKHESTIADDVFAEHGLELESELKHYGKLGMKWGVRRAVGPDGKVTSKVVSDDYKKSRVSKKKTQASLSNNELRDLNTRLQLERSNNDLQSRGTLQKIKTGTAIAGTIIAVGTTINSAIQFAKSPAGQSIKNLIGTHMRLDNVLVLKNGAWIPK